MEDHETPEFRWIERGAGEAIVLVHGLMGTMYHWEPTLEILGTDVRALAPTLPIFDPGTCDLSTVALGEWLLRFLDALAIDRALIGGNSLGGHVAIQAALRCPERVAGLVLTGSSGLLERQVVRAIPHRPSAAWVREKMEEAFHDARFVTPEWVDAVRCTIMDRSNVARVLRSARAARRENLDRRLAEIAVPTLIVWGREDRITPLQMAQRFQSLIPLSDLVVLRNCGHAPMMEQPWAFGAVVRAWMESRLPEMLGAGSRALS